MNNSPYPTLAMSHSDPFLGSTKPLHHQDNLVKNFVLAKASGASRAELTQQFTGYTSSKNELLGAGLKNSYGSNRDEHGCIPSAGYKWCEDQQRCLRPWLEPCEKKMIA